MNELSTVIQSTIEILKKDRYSVWFVLYIEVRKESRDSRETEKIFVVKVSVVHGPCGTGSLTLDDGDS